MILLTPDEIDNIQPPTSQEVFDFVDKHYGNRRELHNMVAAITVIYQHNTAKAQAEKILDEIVELDCVCGLKDVVCVPRKAIKQLRKEIDENTT